MRYQVLVLAKAPVPGRVKTRLCPPCTPVQAAAVAAAALADTLDAAGRCDAVRHTLVLDGAHPAPPGWHVVPQRGDGLATRLTHAYADTALPDAATVLVGMDTPHLDPADVASAAAALDHADAVLGPAVDGGWWLLGLRDPRHATALAAVPMSTPDTGRMTHAALRRRRLTIAAAPTALDVDTAADAWQVAESHPDGAFAASVHRHVPAPVAAS